MGTKNKKKFTALKEEKGIKAMMRRIYTNPFR
jgi:hypothetical protein